jgi:oxygen-independent coproporphyrinogen-3 oxidase
LSKCPYCDFNIYLRREHDEGEWLEAYLQSIRSYQSLMPDREIASIYFGGGTPSLIKPSEVSAIIEEIAKGWRVANDVEITLEANPTSTEMDKFAAFKSAGVNRLSLGVQSLLDDALKFLGRLHDSADVRRAIDIADQVFERFTFDLIYARPDQSLIAWEHELREALPLMKGHLSAYQLTIKEGTAFARQVARGNFKLADDDVLADFYTLTSDIMAANGMPSYEVSNYGAAGQESRHNMIYWLYQDYIGIGPGAHGRIGYGGQKFASEDHKRPAEWMEAVAAQGHGAIGHEIITPRDQFEEILMGGLRVKDGVDLGRAEKETELAWGDVIDASRLDVLLDQGWLSLEDQHLKPSREGWLRVDSILPYILKAA